MPKKAKHKIPFKETPFGKSCKSCATTCIRFIILIGIITLGVTISYGIECLIKQFPIIKTILINTFLFLLITVFVYTIAAIPLRKIISAYRLTYFPLTPNDAASLKLTTLEKFCKYIESISHAYNNPKKLPVKYTIATTTATMLQLFYKDITEYPGIYNKCENFYWGNNIMIDTYLYGIALKLNETFTAPIVKALPTYDKTLIDDCIFYAYDDTNIQIYTAATTGDNFHLIHFKTIPRTQISNYIIENDIETFVNTYIKQKGILYDKT